MDIEPYKTEYRFKTASDTHQYFFESQGVQSIVKVVSISPIAELDGRTISNFGFCDFDVKTGKTLPDTVISNNGDRKEVFATVLSTIPDHFGNNPTSILSVRGSDSRSNYQDLCEPNCKLNCLKDGVSCKKANRRIKMYLRFLNQNYKKFSKDYVFMGIESDNSGILEQYVPGKDYLQVLFFPINTTNLV